MTPTAKPTRRCKTKSEGTKRGAFVLSPLSLLALTACGGNESSDGSTGDTVDLLGAVIKGPLGNAFVFADLNSNGSFDTGEPNARTGSDGSFSLQSTDPTARIVAVTDDSTVDGSSGATLSGLTLSAPAGASVVTPLTTLIDQAGVSKTDLATALGLSGVDLTSFNPYDDTQAGYDIAQAAQAEKVSQQLVNTVKTIAAAAEGAGVDSATAAQTALQSVALAVVDQIATGDGVDVTVNLADASVIATAVDAARTSLTASQADNGGFVAAGFETAATALQTALKLVNDQVAVKADEITTTSTSLNSEQSKALAAGAFSNGQVLADQVKAAANTNDATPITLTSVAAVETATNNLAPQTITVGPLNIGEHATAFTIGTVNVIDKNADGADDTSGSTLSLVLTPDNDSRFFSIAMDNSLTLNDANLNYEEKPSYTFTIKALDGGGKSVSQSFTLVVANENDTPEGTLNISGTAAEDQILTADTTTITDEDGMGSLQYTWLRDGSKINGATDSTYRLTQQDVGAQISVTAQYSDGAGFDNVMTANATDTVANVDDSLLGAVSITGQLIEGETVAVDISGLSDEDGLGTFAYTWFADEVEIAGATGENLTLTQDLIGKALSVEVQNTDMFGNVGAVIGNASALVLNANNAPTGTLAFSGTLEEGQTLTADVSAVQDADGLGAFAYQWYADDIALSGAVSQSLLLSQDHVGKVIKLKGSYQDGMGTTEVLTATSTGTVVNINDAPTGSVNLTGHGYVGQTLSLSETVTDPDGMTTSSKSYVWYRGETQITGATGTTYTLTDADAGQQIKAALAYVDDFQTPETVFSAPTPIVIDPALDIYVKSTSADTVTFAVQVADPTVITLSAMDLTIDYDENTFTPVAEPVTFVRPEVSFATSNVDTVEGTIVTAFVAVSGIENLSNTDLFTIELQHAPDFSGPVDFGFIDIAFGSNTEIANIYATVEVM